MGSPLAQSYLGLKFNTGVEYGDRWSNIPVATKMLECAFSQGDASKTLELAYIYKTELTPDGKKVGWMTPRAKERALRILHEGVKLGCVDCARDLAVDFKGSLSLADILVPFPDMERGERYGELNDALSWNRYRRLPNLDKILPLPPAELPPWDGTRESLLAAAMGVTISPDLPPKAPRPPGNRYFIDPAYHLSKSQETTDASKAPFGGYWQPLVKGEPIADKPPGLYEKDEPFDKVYVRRDDSYFAASGVTWRYYVTVRNSSHEADPIAVPELTRKVKPPVQAVMRRSHEACDVGGIWQPWVSATHPLQSIVNQPWRQVFLRKGQSFPQPRRDWLLDLDEKDVTWHLMEKSGPGMAPKDGG